MSVNPFTYNPYDPLRVVNPYQYQTTTPGATTQGVGTRQATAQDTGWSSYGGPLPGGPGPLYDNNGVASHTPPGAQASGSNPYTGNPWQNYNDPASNSGWNFTSDPYFNAAADHPKWDLAQTGQGSETDRARVWRWTLDDLKAKGLDPGKADQATVQQSYLANIARLKRDYAANGMPWQGSAFSGYDQFLGGQPGATQQGGTNAHDQAWQQAIANASSNPQGASPVADQMGGAVGAGGQRSTPAPSPAPGPVPANQASAQANGQQFYGQAPSEIAGSPDLAYRALLLKMGIDPNIHGMFSSYLKQRLGPAIQAIINASRGNGALPSSIDDLLGQVGQQAFGAGGNWMQYTGGIADKALQNVGGTYGANADMSTLQNYIQSLLGLKAEGLNPVAASGLANGFQDTIGAYGDQGLQNGGVDKSSFLPYFQGTNFYKSVAGR